jgi:antitoxin (DNA-binding transcriptional repressor) of toxin-antitoxin stability system
MDTIPTTRAERELPDLIHRASAGETIIIEAPSGERVRLEPLPGPRNAIRKTVPSERRGG